MSGWTCEVVDSCSGSPLRVDTLVEGAGAIRPLRAMPSRGGGAPKLFRDAAEQTPEGGSKVRWRCPTGTCAVDLTLTWQSLNDVGEKLRDAGIASVELRALATTLSK